MSERRPALLNTLPILLILAGALLPLAAHAAPAGQASGAGDVLPVPSDIEPPSVMDAVRLEPAQPVPEVRTARAGRPFDPDNADLEGIARLDYGPDSAALLAMVGEGALPGPVVAELKVNREGKLAACAQAYAAGDPAIGAWLCQDMIERAQVSVPAGFALPYRQGRVRVTLSWNRVYQPQFPIRLLPQGQGTMVAFSFIPGKPSGYCHADISLIEYADQARLCQALMTSPAVRRKRYSDGSRIRKDADGYASAVAWVAMADLPPSQAVQVYVRESPRLDTTPVVYPAPPAVADGDSANGGHLTLPIGESDYPAFALRKELQGMVRLQLGFGPDGKPLSCRPLESSAPVLLDNATCKIALRRARYRLSDPAQVVSQNARFYNVVVRWMLPGE